jgi:peptide/nickel transport system substrate-binding protein
VTVNPSADGPLHGDPASDITGITRKVLLHRGLGGVVAASSLSALLAACGSDGGAAGTGASSVGKPPATPTGTLRVALASQPRIFDPSLTFSLAELAITGNVYEGLATFNEDTTQLVPALATHWDVSADAREWRFTLRENVKFHDGAVLDSTAVRRSIEYLTRRGSLYGFAAGAPEIDDSDPKVVVFKYKEPFADLARNSSLLAIVSPKLLAGSADAAARRVGASPSGTGPFRFAGTQAGNGVTLTAFDGYWGSGLPHVATLKSSVLPDESARDAALQAGDVDIVMQVPPSAAGTLQATGKLHVETTQTWTSTMIDIACNRAPFDDPRVRQAVAYAIDRQAIVDAVLRGRGALLRGHMPAGLYGARDAATQYAYDPAKAKALLRAAGHSAPIEATLATYTGAVLGEPIIQAIAAQLNKAGFAITPHVLDQATLAKDQFSPNRKTQLAYTEMGWINGGPFHITLSSFTLTSHYPSKPYAGLVAKVNATADGPARKQAIGEAIDLLAQDLPMVPLWDPQRIDATASAVQAYRPPANVYARFENTYLAA